MARGSLKDCVWDEIVVVVSSLSASVVVGATVVISLITVVSFPMSRENKCTMSCTVVTWAGVIVAVVVPMNVVAVEDVVVNVVVVRGVVDVVVVLVVVVDVVVVVAVVVVVVAVVVDLHLCVFCFV